MVDKMDRYKNVHFFTKKGRFGGVLMLLYSFHLLCKKSITLLVYLQRKTCTIMVQRGGGDVHLCVYVCLVYLSDLDEKLASGLTALKVLMSFLDLVKGVHLMDINPQLSLSQILCKLSINPIKLLAGGNIAIQVYPGNLHALARQAD